MGLCVKICRETHHQFHTTHYYTEKSTCEVQLLKTPCCACTCTSWSVTAICLSGAGVTIYMYPHQFCILLKDTSTHGLQGTGIKPLAFQSGWPLCDMQVRHTKTPEYLHGTCKNKTKNKNKKNKQVAIVTRHAVANEIREFWSATDWSTLFNTNNNMLTSVWKLSLCVTHIYNKINATTNTHTQIQKYRHKNTNTCTSGESERLLSQWCTKP